MADAHLLEVPGSQRLLRARPAAKALQGVVTSLVTNEFIVVFDHMCVTTRAAASNSFRGPLSPFTHECILVRSLTCVNDAERYVFGHRVTSYATNRIFSRSVTPAPLPDIAESTLESGHISVLTQIVKRPLRGARP